MGGGDLCRQYWTHTASMRNNNYLTFDAYLFVLDATDRAHFGFAFAELKSFLEDKRVPKRPLLILANKQDLPRAASKFEVEKVSNKV